MRRGARVRRGSRVWRGARGRHRHESCSAPQPRASAEAPPRGRHRRARGRDGGGGVRANRIPGAGMARQSAPRVDRRTPVLPQRRRLSGAALTCSGGAAAMLADYAQVVGLRLPPPSGQTADLPEALARVGGGECSGGTVPCLRRADPGACSWLETADAAAPYRITNGFAIGSLDRFIQTVLGRV